MTEFRPKDPSATAPEVAGDIPGVKDHELEPQNGVWAADGMSLKFAADAGRDQLGFDLVLPPEAVGDPDFVGLTDITINGLNVTALIDTGFLKWNGDVAKDEFRDYNGATRQAAQIQTVGHIAFIDKTAVSCAPMHTEDGKDYYLWVAETPLSGNETNPTRYGLIRKARELIVGYDQARAEGKAHRYTDRKIPAVSADWSSPLPEIVEANPILENAEQVVKLRLDYTGARAAAKTIIIYRSSNSPNEYIFGQRGPVTYWFTSEGGQIPFAVCQTTPEAWLAPNQNPDFNVAV
jgi:hypothetical protein